VKKKNWKEEMHVMHLEHCWCRLERSKRRGIGCWKLDKRLMTWELMLITRWWLNSMGKFCSAIKWPLWL